MWREAADCHMLLRMVRQIKGSSDQFRCIFVVYHRGAPGIISWGVGRVTVAKVFSESVA